MIEIFDSSCSRSLGQSASIRAAIDILNSLSAAGRPGTNAMLCTYRGSSPRQEYIAVCRDGKWRRRASFAVKLGPYASAQSLATVSSRIYALSGCPKMCGRALAAPVCFFCMAVHYLPALRIRICHGALRRPKGAFTESPVEYDLLLQTSGSIWPCIPAPHRLSKRSPSK